MGLLSDTLEDGRERLDQVATVDYVPLELPPARPPDVACPVCDHTFASDLAMQHHIAREHAASHVYIKADDRIVRTMEVLPETPRRCQLILLGVDKVDVQVKAGPRSTRFATESTIDFSDHIPSGHTGEVQITVQYARVVKKFLMYFGTTPPFDQRRLDKEIMHLQKCLEQGKDPDWGSYQQRQQEISRNSLEKVYSEGFFAGDRAEDNGRRHLQSKAPRLHDRRKRRESGRIAPPGDRGYRRSLGRRYPRSPGGARGGEPTGGRSFACPVTKT